MKIIISHDVDHISAAEHLFDLFLVKHAARNTLELLARSISLSEYFNRYADIFGNKLNNTLDLVEYEKHRNIPSCYFIAVRKGLGLSYTNKRAARLALQLINNGINVGIHGIEYQAYSGILQERDSFHNLSGIGPRGIRMHYLRTGSETLTLLERAGYKFDTSVLSSGNPYISGNIWEFPVHLMDSSLFYNGSKYQKKTLAVLKEDTISIIDKAIEENIRFFNIVTHDLYFSDSYRKWRQWYCWLIDYFYDHGLEFSSYDAAIEELSH